MPDEDIVRDYALTTYGVAPSLPFFVARFSRMEAYRENWIGFVNNGSARFAYESLSYKKAVADEDEFSRIL